MFCPHYLNCSEGSQASQAFLKGHRHWDPTPCGDGGSATLSSPARCHQHSPWDTARPELSLNAVATDLPTRLETSGGGHSSGQQPVGSHQHPKGSKCPQQVRRGGSQSEMASSRVGLGCAEGMWFPRRSSWQWLSSHWARELSQRGKPWLTEHVADVPSRQLSPRAKVRVGAVSAYLQRGTHGGADLSLRSLYPWPLPHCVPWAPSPRKRNLPPASVYPSLTTYEPRDESDRPRLGLGEPRVMHSAKGKDKRICLGHTAQAILWALHILSTSVVARAHTEQQQAPGTVTLSDSWLCSPRPPPLISLTSWDWMAQ